MSRASKIFFGTAMAFCGITVWGVHYMQKQESENMYQGVLKDEERVRQRALLRAPVTAVTQPAAVVDDECVTCVISPPPDLVESQSKAERARDRALRQQEYEAQKALQSRLLAEQGKSA